MRQHEVERLQTEIRAIREVLAIAEEQEESPGSPPHPRRQNQVEFYLRQNNLEYLLHVDNDQLRTHLDRIERDLRHAENGWE